MRLCIAVILLFVFVGPALAKRLQLSAEGSTGLTYNDNITLSRADVNFGPGVLAKADTIGSVRVRSTLRADTSELAYTGSRVHFYDNIDLSYVENALELNHDQKLGKWGILRAQGLMSRVDPDLVIRSPDQNGAFPFTTSEPPDRQIFQAILTSLPDKPTAVSVRALSQNQQYSNNPLLDAEADAVQVAATQVIDPDKKWSAGVEAQQVGRDYPNLVGPVPGSQVQTNVRNGAVQVSYLPNKHFGFLLKSLWLDQDANVDTFFLDQHDVSLAASWEGDKWGSASLLAQRSRRDFSRRALAGGATQLDRDFLVVLQVSKRLGDRSAVTFGYTYDRNRSNSVDSDYSNNIERLEFTRSF